MRKAQVPGFICAFVPVFLATYPRMHIVNPWNANKSFERFLIYRLNLFGFHSCTRRDPTGPNYLAFKTFQRESWI